MNQMTFGILCLVLALLLLLISGLRKLIKAIQRHRRHSPDLRERGYGGGYSRGRRWGRSRYNQPTFGSGIRSYRGRKR